MEGPAQRTKRRAPSISTASAPVSDLSPLSSRSSHPTPPSTSSRVTRSSARQAAAEASKSQDDPDSTGASSRPSLASRKRKARVAVEIPEAAPQPVKSSPSRRTKRQKVTAPQEDLALRPPPPSSRTTRQTRTRLSSTMSAAGNDTGSANEASSAAAALPPKSSRRRSGRNKKVDIDSSMDAGTAPSTRRSRRGAANGDGDVKMADAGSKDGRSPSAQEDDSDGLQGHEHEVDDEDELGRDLDDDDDEDDENDRHHDDDDDDDDDDHMDEDDDPFATGYLSGSGHAPPGFASTLRALSGLLPGVSSRLRDILSHLQQKDDLSVRLIALQDLSEVLLVSTEDNLSGHFSPEPFVKELVSLMEPDEFGDENPEIMLLACRCIANLMEALPSSTANVVYGGAVPVLCQKLLEIHYIDLAEQSLSTLEKISVEFPASIVRAGGLTACLTYLDFFATSTQRTAVTTAANCCRNLSEDNFPVVHAVMPILLNVLGSSDQKVVEQACLCVCRIVESFRFLHSKLEELVSPDLLRAILRLLLPGTTNLIGPHIHTQFLRVLAITARASPKLSAALFKMSIVDTLYQILTGVSPPGADADVATEIDSVVIMQALIHRPREQIVETLNVIYELLPGLPVMAELETLGPLGIAYTLSRAAGQSSVAPLEKKTPTVDERVELLADCQGELKRFATVLLPTLTDAYSSTVNRGVREKVLAGQLKMLSHLDIGILEDALRDVPYASFLASILAQRDQPTMVLAALQAADLLIRRLGRIYRYQFYREGVMAEIHKLAEGRSDDAAEPAGTSGKAPPPKRAAHPHSSPPPARTKGKRDTERPHPMPEPLGDSSDGSHDDEDDEEDEEVEEEEVDDDDDDDDEDDEHDDEQEDDIQDDVTTSPVSSQNSSSFLARRERAALTRLPSVERHIATTAKSFLQNYETGEDGRETRERATKILNDLKDLASELKACYLHGRAGRGADLFWRLAKYFVDDPLDSITSYELLNSGMMQLLLDMFSNSAEKARIDARAAFLEVFMAGGARHDFATTGAKASATPFGALIHKLQDLLSRAEHFEVVTIQQNPYDGGGGGSSGGGRGSPTSMLSKQLRLKLVAEEESGIPRSFRNVMVSIHAIATFKALDDYLRPRISVSERPRASKHRENVAQTLAAYAAAAGIPAPRMPDPRLPSSTTAVATPGASTTTPPATQGPFSRSVRKSAKTKLANAGAQPPPSAATPSAEKPSGPRRSGRKRQTKNAPPPAPQSGPSGELESLECADEKRLADPGNDDMDEAGALDAILGDLNETVAEATPKEPSAVHMEVASSGKVTARKEDGTRVATPSQASVPSSQTPPAPQVPSTEPAASASAVVSTPGLPTRHRSYAAAIQAIPSDWHIEFSIGDRPISSDTTIYRAVHSQKIHSDSPSSSSSSSRSAWSAIHTIKFRRVAGPPPPESSTTSTAASAGSNDISSDLPDSLNKNLATSAILRLLNILHALNANIDDVLAEKEVGLKLQAEPVSQFVNTKLTAKLNRQLEEPLIVASHCLPGWSEDLARYYPFLFPFETRHLFLRSTSFGYSRSVARWQSARSATESRQDRHRDDRSFLGRLQRQKVRISRGRILDSAIKVLELYGASSSILEVEYFEEVGTGLGPTLEFYSTVSKEFSKKRLKLWRETECNHEDEFAFSKRGLFPAPMSEQQAETDNGKKIIQLFRVLGRFVARSMLDSRIIDISFNPTFFRIGDGPSTVSPSLGAVRAVDEGLASSLKLVKQFANVRAEIDEDVRLSDAEKTRAAAEVTIQGVCVDDLGLDFTLPGYPYIELQASGSNVPVTIDNIGLYLERVIDMTLGSGVQKQVAAFRAGFSSVFPYSALKAFTPDELVMLFGRVQEDWSLETLMDSIKADHGFNMDSRSVRNLLQAMSELTPAERREFLQFVTGSPKLPIGGFKRLTPMFTVVCKPSEPPYTSDDYLPSVMTCVNYLKLPDYTSMEVMRKRLQVAISEGQGAFHLS